MDMRKKHEALRHHAILNGLEGHHIVILIAHPPACNHLTTKQLMTGCFTSCTTYVKYKKGSTLPILSDASNLVEFEKTVADLFGLFKL